MAAPEPTRETGPYTARGNEPFWRLDVNDTAVRWTTPEQTLLSEEPAVQAPTPVAPGWRGFSVWISGETLMAEIRPVACQDTMSGQTYPDTVTVTFQGGALEGCGGAPMDLLVGSWRLEQVGDAPALAGPQTASLMIATDGTLSGSTGCNRMFGRLMVTGEGITIEGMGTTRMACLDPGLSAQEQRVTQGLAGATAFSIDAEGRLVLPSGDGAPLRWVRVSP
jgi:heat shock protein HslJ